jgi:aromatic-L-amino-acid decarboxylase
LEGCDRADSFVTNPHKWLFTPIDLSAFYCRRPEILRQAFNLTPEYLQTNVDENVTNYMDYGLALGRRFRALKLWMVIRYFGREGLRERLRQHITWAENFADWIDSSSKFERMAPTPFSTICFRAVPEGFSGEALNRFNEAVLEEVNRSGELFLSHTRLRGKFTLRLAIGNLKTRSFHLDRAKEILLEAADSKPAV